MTEELLKLENLTIGYSKPVCKAIHAVVKKGELVGLTGKNGSGKSTLIRTILGLQPKLSGIISFYSEDIDHWSLNKKSREISVVFSRLNNVPPLTVFDLVALGRLPYSNGFSKFSKTENELIESSLDKVGIIHLKDKLAGQLSDGQLQMVMIARALAQDTNLIVMDEPTSHLDIENQFRIFELIYKLSKETQKTFIVASHQVELILHNSTQLWWIDNGEFHSGFPEQLAYKQKIYEKLSQKRIRFDYQSGSFQFLHKISKEVNLVGEGNDFEYWVKHALERNGFGINRNSETKIELKQYQIFVNKFKFENIGDLLTYLINQNG